MGRKNSESCCSSHGDDIEEEEITIEEQVIEKIKELPTLAEKVQAIAINTFLIEKRALDKKLEAEVNKIEVTHRKTYEPFLTEIFNIASGIVDLTDEDLEGVDHLLTEQEKEVKKNYYPKKPIEEYWLKAFISSDALAESVHPDDENTLKHLINVQASKAEDGSNLTVTFFFSENEWFTNQSIKKEFEIEGDEIKRSYGDSIEWKEGKNLTVETIKKKNKKKKTTTTKIVEKESFFNIFKEIDLTEEDQETENAEKDEDEEQLDANVEKLERQYEICNTIYGELLPRSLEFYLGVVGGMDFDDLCNIPGVVPEEDEEDEEEEESGAGSKKSKSKNKKRKGSNH